MVISAQCECQSAEIQSNVGQRGVTSNYDSRKVTGINEITVLSLLYLGKPQPRERAWDNRQGKKTLLSLTLVLLCEAT